MQKCVCDVLKIVQNMILVMCSEVWILRKRLCFGVRKPTPTKVINYDENFGMEIGGFAALREAWG